MAVSKTPDQAHAPVLDALASFLAHHTPQHITLAYSGGMDSTVLLHALIRLQPDYDFQLQALHVHHGLSPHADAWTQHCLAQAKRWAVPCKVVPVQLEQRQKGVEAEARRLRYAVLSEQASEWVLTAHHRRDQAETVLLNLLRGSGVAGLGGMAQVRWLNHDIQLGRPLLSVSWRAVQAYARQHRLSWVEDETNTQLRFRRNWVRHRLLPFLLAQFPAAEAKLAQVASHMQEAQTLLQALAQQDLTSIENRGRLEVKGLLALSVSRRHNLLRYWFYQRHGLRLTRQHLQALDALLQASPDRYPQVRIAGQVATRFQGKLFFPKPQLSPWQPVLWCNRDQLPFRFVGKLPDKTRLVPFAQTGLVVKPYKKAFQRAGIPPWLRPWWPVTCRAGKPAYILGVGPVDKTLTWPEAASVQVALTAGIG